jgi:hypothetical protein
LIDEQPWYLAAVTELEDAPIGTLLVAGADVMQKLDSIYWWRREDNTKHPVRSVADFHGYSGYSLILPLD